MHFCNILYKRLSWLIWKVASLSVRAQGSSSARWLCKNAAHRATTVTVLVMTYNKTKTGSSIHGDWLLRGHPLSHPAVETNICQHSPNVLWGVGANSEEDRAKLGQEGCWPWNTRHQTRGSALGLTGWGARGCTGQTDTHLCARGHPRSWRLGPVAEGTVKG